MNKSSIAIIGVSCKFPGADNFEEYINNLENKINSISQIEKERWDIEEYYSEDINGKNKTVSKWCGQISNFEYFDNSFFNISAREAKNMDPQQRILMEQTMKCIEDSGLAPSRLRDVKTSVYVGFMDNDYHQYVSNLEETVEPYSCLGNYSCILANRLSYHFGLTGESIAVDAACASSLVAIHKAKESLRLGQCDYAVVAGVNLNIHPWKYISFSRSHMLSPDGQCKTFDKDANGYVPGDGVGVLLLQRAVDAEKQNNNIYGLILGSSVNHTGRTISITAPSIAQQEEVILSAYKDGDVNPETISYIEAHGTGTSLGDPIEVSGLTNAFRNFTDRRQYCKIGSVKTNIGHLEAAAGVAGIIKIIGMMQRKLIFPTLNIMELNPIIDFENSPFLVADECEIWKPINGKCLRSGISSFGMGGANAHLVLESYEPMMEEREPVNDRIEPKQLFVLSAKTENSLNAIKEEWGKRIHDNDITDTVFRDACDTLMFGREQYKHRFVVEVSDVKELSDKLKIEEMNRSFLYQGKVRMGFGKIELKGIKDIHESILNNSIYQKYLKESLEQLVEITGNNRLKTSYYKTKWVKGYIEIFNVVSLYSITNVLKEVGIQPEYIYGESAGNWVGLICSGIIEVKDIYRLLLKSAIPEEAAIQLPAIPCSINGEDINPVVFTGIDLENIFALADVALDEFKKLTGKGKILLESQFTFKKFMEEWNEGLEQYGLYAKGIMDDLRFYDCDKHKKETILLYLMISSSMRKLNRKWNFKDMVYGNEYTGLLVDLITKEYITKTDVIDILLSEHTDLNKVANCMNETVPKCRELYSTDLLSEGNATGRKQLLNVICNFVKKVETAEKIGKELTILIGNFNNSKENEAQLLLTSQELFSGSWNQLLAHLWNTGVNINWQAIHDNTNYRKVPLPTYKFDQKPFLTGAMKTTKEQKGQKTNVAEGEYSVAVSSKQPVIADHIITGQTIIPAASMVEIIVSIYNTQKKLIQGKFSNILFEHPCIMSTDKELMVKLYKDDSLFILKDGETVLCRGSYNKDSQNAKVSNLEEREEGKNLYDAESLYELFKVNGYQYGHSLQVISRANVKDGYCYTVLEEEGGERILSANLLDGAFQAVIAYYLTKGGMWKDRTLYVPFYVKSMEVFGTLAAKCTVRMKEDIVTNNGDSLITDLDIFDSDGKIVMRIKGLTLKQVSDNFLDTMKVTAKKSEQRIKTYESVWEENDMNFVDASTDGRTGILVKLDEYTAQQQIKEIENSYKDVYSFTVNKSIATDMDKQITSDSIDAFTKKFVELMKSDQLQGRKLDIYFFCKDEKIEVISTEQAQLAEKTLQILFETVKAVGGYRRRNEVSILINTVNALKVLPEDRVEGFYNGGVTGFAKTVMREFKSIKVKVLDIDERLNAVNYIKECITVEAAPIVAVRNEKRFTEKIKLFTADKPRADKKLLKQDGTYLLVGGAGGIGKKVTESLVKHCNSNLVLIGRSPQNSDRSEWIAKMNQKGYSVSYYSTDISNYVDLKHTVSDIVRKFGQINGVIQMSGILEDSLVLTKETESFLRVMKPKIMGTVNLHLLTEKEPLDFFLSFSSVVAHTGNMGQCDYASANAFLDAFSHYRSGKGNGRTVCIDWTLWSDGGMGRDGNAMKQIGKLGIKSVSAEDAIDTLWTLLDDKHTQVLVLANNYEDISNAMQKNEAPIHEELKLKKSVVKKNTDTIRKFLTEILSEILEINKEEINEDTDFSEYGIDSIGIMDFVDRISVKYGDQFHHATVMEHSNLKDLSLYIEKYFPDNSEEDVDAAISYLELNKSVDYDSNIRYQDIHEGNQDIAVISLAGRFPQSPNIERFWDNLLNGRYLVDEVPIHRFDISQYYSAAKESGKTYSKWGGFIENIGSFDPNYFRIDEREAINIDPQQRLFLELVQELFDRSGYSTQEVGNTKTSVYVGAHESNYGRKIQGRNKYFGAQGVVNVISNLIPGRVMQYFNLRGSAETVYTACSSSLVAVHKACKALNSGECNMAIAGGIELILDEEWYLGFSSANVLSSEGKCRVFDRNADGFVLGEGFGGVLLKRLDDAIKDGDMIHGVIKASAINNDGQTLGLTTPSLSAQKEVIRETLETGKINASTISLYEAHGTGTQLGDPIEVKAASESYREYTEDLQYCAIGSVKSNVGHMLSAAGIVSFIKVLLALDNKQIPPTINCHEIHPRYGFENSPFYPAQKARYWIPVQNIRRAAISSFGFGGTNCHMIVDEFEEKKYVYKPRRKPLPFARYNKKHYLLGDDVASELEVIPRKIFMNIQNKKLSPDRAKELILKWKDYTFGVK